MKKNVNSIPTGHHANEQFGSKSFNTSKQRFFYAIKWNTFESVLYHGIFIGHQAALYAVLGSSRYGKVGALFGFSFLCVSLLMGALDTALIAHIKTFTQSKERFKVLIDRYLIPHCLFVLSAPLLLLLLKASNIIKATQHISWEHCWLVGIFIAGQTIKKLLRHVLQLMFYNKYTASIEVLDIALYTSIFWGAYLLGYSINLYLLLLPFIGTSLVSAISSLYFFYTHLETAPAQSNHNAPVANVRTTQLFAYINHISKSLFSSNFLVPLFAMHTGFAQAGIISISNYTMHTLTFFIHKICGPAAAALFGDTNTLSHKEKTNAFQMGLQALLWVITFTIFLLITYCTFYNSHLSLHALSYALFFLGIHILEHVFTLFEKFFIAQKRTALLAFLNIINCTIAAYSTWMLISTSFLSAVILCFVLRATLLITLSCIVYSPKKSPFFSFFYRKSSKTSF